MQNTISLHKQLKRFQLSFAFLVINPRTASRNPCRYSSTKRPSYIETKSLITSNYFMLSFQTCVGESLLRQCGPNSDYFKLSLWPGTYSYASGIYTLSTLTLIEWRIASLENCVSVHGQDLDTNWRYDAVLTLVDTVTGNGKVNTTSINLTSLARTGFLSTVSIYISTTVLGMVTCGNCQI
jgi:hypothetical protein